MKKLIINNTLIRSVFVLLVMANFISCEEEEVTTIANPYIIQGSADMIYENITTYSYKQNMTTAEPQFDLGTTVYAFSILSVNLDGAEMTSGLSVFTIDPESGVISIDNTSSNLIPGSSYNFNVGIGNVNGIIKKEDAFILTVLDIPMDYSITNTSYTANFLENVDVATVSYLDTSTNGDVLSDISYSLVGAPVGFSINADTGVISKNSSASSGTHVLSVSIDSEIGAKTFTDILTVTVGEAPTIQYVQADGTTSLTNVVMSPWTGYTTVAPVIVGMNVTNYEIVLPAEIPSGAIIANADGTVSVLADKNLSTGIYSLDVIATNAGGISVTFEDIFTITIENRWEASDLFNDTFDDGNTGDISPGNALYPDYSGYSLGAASNAWTKAVVEKSGSPTIEGIRVQNPGTNQHYLVKSIDITGVKALKISFGEQLGYNQGFVDNHDRGLYVGESTSDLEGGSFNPGNWVEVMADNDSRWSGSPTWSSRVPSAVNNISVDLSSITGTTLKLAWFIGTSTPQNGQYIIDYCNAQYAAAFAAEEQ